MCSELVSAKLSEYLLFKNGKSSPDRYDEAPFPVFGSNGLIGHAKKINSDRETLIIGRVGSYCGSVHYSDKPCWVSDNAIICTSKNPDEILFWYYFLTFADLNQYRSGSGQPLLNQSTLNSISCTIPRTANERVRIGQILRSFDEKHSLNEQINQTLEQMAQAIFKSWFVDFEPVKAKMVALETGGSEEDTLIAAMQAISGKDQAQLARFKTEQPEQYNELRTTAELFPCAMQDSELGEIPEGWFYGELNDICELNKASWTKRTIPSEIKYVDLANTKNGNIESTTLYASNEAPSRARRKLNLGDTIIGTVRPGNRSFALISDNSENLTGSTGFAVLTPKSRSYAEFLYISATTEESINYLAHLADGGAYPAVRPETVSKLPSIIPSDILLKCFHRVVAPYFTKIAANKTESSTLDKVKLALLPRLLSGELNIAGSELEMEASS